MLALSFTDDEIMSCAITLVTHCILYLADIPANLFTYFTLNPLVKRIALTANIASYVQQSLGQNPRLCLCTHLYGRNVRQKAPGSA